MIDAVTVKLSDVNGIDFANPVFPHRSSLRDVATPWVNSVDGSFIGKQFPEDCDDSGSDGLLDAVFRFPRDDVLAEIELTLERPLIDRETLVISLTALLTDGTPIFGEDVVIILLRGRR